MQMSLQAGKRVLCMLHLEAVRYFQRGGHGNTDRGCAARITTFNYYSNDNTLSEYNMDGHNQ